jgi:DNA repair photolyase
MQSSFLSPPSNPEPTNARPGPSLNEDGFSVRGCQFIYAPAGQAGEYSMLASNPYRGCGHRCVYCYVPQVIKMDRALFDAGAESRPNFLLNLRKDAIKYQALGIDKQVMLSFTTDPFNQHNTELTGPTIDILKGYGLAVCTLTKGGARALPYIDMFRTNRDAFASTLTSLEDDFSLRWEPGAALPGERMDTLKKFYDRGIFTWVSLEPVLDTAATLKILETKRHYVNFFKIGRVNYSGLTKKIDWEDFTHRVIDLCARYDIPHYLKKDLQPYMPAGYSNPKYVTQHN